MADDKDELSPDELDALLSDLESRAGGGSKGGAGADAAAASDDDEDIEAFLAGLESEESSAAAPKKQVAQRDPLDDEFAALESAPEAEMVVAEESAPAAEEGDKKAKKKKKPKVVERGESKGLRRAARIAKWLGVLIPALALWWVLGAFLGQWVSAGWLILVLATVVVVGLPFAVKALARRGRYPLWLALVSLVGVAALVAPMPQTASSVLQRYGHWPASTLSQLAGWEADNAAISGSAWAAGLIGGWLDPAAETAEAPRRLGTEFGLEEKPTVPVAPAPETPTPTQPTTGEPPAPVPAPAAPAPAPAPAPSPAPETPTAAPTPAPRAPNPPPRAAPEIPMRAP